MTFKLHPFGAAYVIESFGQIESGDRGRLVSAIDAVPIGSEIMALSLNSAGGQIFEAERMASTIRSNKLPVVVPAGNYCASACFLLFAAATKKYVFSTSYIGVHSVSENGAETLGSMGFTTAMARDAAAYGVPDTIIGRMVATQPGQIAWLTQSDLAALGAMLIEDTSTTPAAASKPQGTDIPSDAMVSSGGRNIAAFDQGRADRIELESWIKGLEPSAQIGAQFWASQRSLKKPGSCYQPPSPPANNAAAWSEGCIEARTRFIHPDTRRKTEPDYKAGWNSY